MTSSLDPQIGRRVGACKSPLGVVALCAALFGGLAFAAPAQADVVLLDDGTEVRGHAIVIGQTVQVHSFAGVRSIPKARVLALVTDDGRRSYARALDSEGLFAQALEAARAGDFDLADALRREASLREVERRAEVLTRDDEAGWARLRTLAAVLEVEGEVVAALRLKGRERPGEMLAERSFAAPPVAVDAGASAPRLQIPPRPSADLIAMATEAARSDERTATAARSPMAVEADDEDGLDMTWQRARSLPSGLRGSVVVIIPGRGVLPPPTVVYGGPNVIYGGVGGGSAPVRRRRLPGGQTYGAAFGQGRQTFGAATGGRTLFQSLQGQRSQTFGAAFGQGGSTFRAAR